MSLAKNGSSSHIPSFSRARALKVDVKTKKWSALLCAGETATQRLRALYVAVPMCGAKGTREGDSSGYYTVYGRVYVHPRQRGGVTEGRKIHLATSFIFIP